MAADSRRGYTKTGSNVESFDDSGCKIAVLPGETVFTAAGILGRTGRRWTAASEAVAAAEHIIQSRRMERSEGDSVLERWAQAMMQKLAEFSKEQLVAYADANEGKLVTGILGGTEGEGVVWLHAVTISYPLSYQGYTLTSLDPPTAYYVLGKAEIFTEFEKDQKSERAVAERKNWDRMKLTGVAFDQFKTRRLVELTAIHHRNKLDVGGPIDVIEIDASGPHWLALKRDCRDK
ncbi:MAG: hypothetical protein HY508_03275 [Acidobacteria bacterium]|nr:hypothetical protein [Acidobacteriota bacterium]